MNRIDWSLARNNMKGLLEALSTMTIDDLLERNRAFAAGRTPQPLPAAEAVSLAIVACFDPRLDPLLRPALGLGEGEGFMLRTAGAVIAPGSQTLRNLALAVYLFEVDLVLIVGHSSCRMASFPTGELIDGFRRRGVSREAFGTGDLRHWAGAIATPRDGVQASAAAIAAAPFLPSDLAVCGAVLDDASGALELILRPGEPLPSAPDGVRDVADNRHQPPVPVEALHPALGELRQIVERLATAGKVDDLRRLQGAVKTEVYPQGKLALLRRFVQRAAADSPEVQAAFTLLQSQLEGAGHDLAARTFSHLFGPLLRPGSGQTGARRQP